MEEVRGSSPLSSTHYFSWSGFNRLGVILGFCLVLTGRGGQNGGLAGLAVGIEDVIHRFRAASYTGRNSLRYTFSVVRVLAWPTRCAMSSIGIPALDSSETKLCRNSRGVHSSAWSPACSATWRNARRTLAASRGVPRCVVKTRSLSGHRAGFACDSGSASAMGSKCDTHSFGSSRVRRDSRVLVSPPSRADRHSCTLGGSPSRSIWLQVSAHNSSVRAPVSNETRCRHTWRVPLRGC